ncbi:MAG TPA: carboxylesterase family protein [Gemmatimonadales bacterium]|nr:carboxylesterase family protein [Gemmatimonadales bacterium]
MKCSHSVVTIIVALAVTISTASAQRGTGPRVRTANGLVQGVTEPHGIQVFKGIPFAAPPVRALRWRPPEPVHEWQGVRRADRFGPQCMQMRVFGDMVFRNSGVSEDCLYLNVWTPAASGTAHRPVLVYFYGGGFVAGDGSEFRYDGESLARRGIVVVTVSYRLGIFGFFAHPALTAESGDHASGDYALLDQVQALLWVRRNIAAFGGDPDKVTIGGESAGSFSVSALMASPLARGLFRGAIGESGSILGDRAPVPLDSAEQRGLGFAKHVGAASLADLRGIPAMQLLLEASRPGVPRFAMTVDGYFLPKPPLDIYAAGEQAHVPLLVGWNSTEMGPGFLLGSKAPTPANFEAAVRALYGTNADAVLRVYPAANDSEARASATALASDRFIVYGTWKWAEMQRTTGDAPVYRYLFARPRPPLTAEGLIDLGNPGPQPGGAVHSAEIEYALGNLATNPMHAWTEDDYAVSRVMEGYIANFITTGDPNGAGLPTWPAAGSSPDGPVRLMRIDVHSGAEVATHRDRYLLLDRLRSP